jgi:hypothetical protein
MSKEQEQKAQESEQSAKANDTAFQQNRAAIFAKVKQPQQSQK